MDVKYIGSIGVKKSMRSLAHRKRSEVAKESINRLREANEIGRNGFENNKKHLYDSSLLDDEPNLEHSGEEVQLKVTSTHLKLISIETGDIIIQHEMPNVSFASSGDEDTVNFVGYVAKDSKFGRACFVLECGYGSAKEVLETIARQFQLRTQQILYNNCTLPRTNSNNIAQERFSNFNDEATNLCFKERLPPNEKSILLTRALLEKEHWYHGCYLCREESERRLKQDGDFLVRESLLGDGNFVLSIMHNGEKLHLLFDSGEVEVKTKTKKFDSISHLVKFHHEEGTPIVAENKVIYLRNGIRRKV